MLKKTTLLLIMLISSFYGYTQAIYRCPDCGSDCDTSRYEKPGNCPHCLMELIRADSTAKAQATKKLKILFYLQEGVEVLDFAGPMEVFSYAGFEIQTVSKYKTPITSQGILKIIPDYSITDAPPADIIAFFGGNAGNAANDPEIITWLKGRQVPEYYFSVCTGAFILARAGFLDGLTVTTFHQSIESLRQTATRSKVVSGVRFVDNGKVITTAGISAGIDGALHLVAKIKGQEAALQIARYMEYDRWVPGQGLIMP